MLGFLIPVFLSGDVESKEEQEETKAETDFQAEPGRIKMFGKWSQGRPYLVMDRVKAKLLGYGWRD